jgi:hypothetical protein
MILTEALPFLAATFSPLIAFFSATMQFFSTRSDSGPKFPPLLEVLFIASRRPLVRYGILTTGFSIALVEHAVFSRLGRLGHAQTKLRTALTAFSGFSLAFTIIGLPYLSPFRSPILSLVNGIAFAFCACVFHAVLD